MSDEFTDEVLVDMMSCFTLYFLFPQVKLSSDQRCVVCGVQVAMHSVLGDAKAGAHVIIVTRGDNRSELWILFSINF